MYPVVEQYIAAAQAADETFNAQQRAAQDKQSALQQAPEWRGLTYTEQDAAYSKYYEELTVLNNARADAKAAAWNLLAASDDPLVRFIHQECESYPDHARQILEILPADFPAMRDLARRNGWCDVFDRFAAAAVRAKLIKEDRSAARKKLETFLRGVDDIDRHDMREILELVDATVATEVRRALVAERKAVRLAQKEKAVPKAATQAKSKAKVAVTA